MVWRRNVCALLSPWRCRQVSLSCVSFLQLCCPAFYVFLYLCLPHHILTLCTKIRKVVGLSTHPLPRILNISSHLIKPLQSYRVVINMPAFPVKKLRHGGIKGVTQASSSWSKARIWTSDTHRSCHWDCHKPSLPRHPAYPHLKASAIQWAREAEVSPRAPPTFSGELDLLRLPSAAWDTNWFSIIPDPEM